MADLKAYSVQAEDEGCVVFAAQSVVARREGANQLNTEFDGVESCRRAPEFDQYAPGPVPLRAMQEAGWWRYCDGCQTTIHGMEAYDDEGNEIEPVIVGRPGRERMFCSPACRRSHVLSRRAEKTRRRIAGRETKRRVLSRFPTAMNIYPYESPKLGVWRASFLLPGLADNVSWNPDEPTLSVTLRDRDTFIRIYSPKTEAAA